MLKKSKQSYSRHLRKEKRQNERDKKISTTAKRLLEDVVTNVIGEKNPKSYNVQKQAWESVISRLNEEMISNSSKKAVFNELSSLFSSQFEHAPDIIKRTNTTTLQREETLRNEQWHISTKLIMDWYYAEHLNKAPTAEKTLHLKFTFIERAWINGGICHEEYLKALENAIDGPHPLVKVGSRYAITCTILPDKNFPSNTSEIIDGETQYLHQFYYYPDDVNLFILNLYLFSKQKADKCTNNENLPASATATLVSSIPSKCSTIHGIDITLNTCDHSLPQILVEYAIGNITSVSLPLSYLRRLNRNPSIALNYNENYHSKKIPKTETKCGNSTNTFLISKNTYAIQHLRKIIRDKNSTRIQRIDNLYKLSDSCVTQNEKVMVDWSIHHLEDRKNSPSTALRYLSAISTGWLIETYNIRLDSLDGSDFIQIYKTILQEYSDDKTSFNAYRCMDFHNFLTDKYGFSKLDGSLSEYFDENIINIRAGYIDEPLFSSLLQAIDAARDIDHYRKLMIKTIFIFLYRGGFRKSEIEKLRMIDVEKSQELNIDIRDNRFGRNKTSSAYRRIPLDCLLLPDERRIILSYITERTYHKDKRGLFFHDALNIFEPFNMNELGVYARNIMQNLSEGLYYCLHTFRHTAISRLQIIAHYRDIGIPEILSRCIPYNKQQIETIYSCIFGNNRKLDLYHCLAAYAGHLTPDITLKNYCHFTDIIMASYLSRKEQSINRKALAQIASISDKKARAIFQKEIINTAELIKHYERSLTTYVKTETLHTQQDSVTQLTTPPNPLDFFPILEPALLQYSQGFDYSYFAYSYGLDEHSIGEWHQIAEHLKNIPTNKGNPRLNTAGNLLPDIPTKREDFLDFNRALTRFRKLVTNGQQEDVKKFIQLHLTRHITEHNTVKLESPEEFEEYMRVGKALFSLNRWTILLKCHNDECTKKWKQVIKINFEEKPLRKKIAFPQGVGYITLLRKKDDPQGNSRSSVLRVLCHRLAILLFTATEVKNWIPLRNPK